MTEYGEECATMGCNGPAVDWGGWCWGCLNRQEIAKQEAAQQVRIDELEQALRNIGTGSFDPWVRGEVERALGQPRDNLNQKT